MKTRFTKIALAMVLVVALVVPMVVVPVGAAEVETTFDFTDSSSCESIDKDKQVWSQNGIVLTNTKGSSTTAVNNYTPSGHIRIYKNSDVTIECAGMTKIVFTCTAAKYGVAPTGLEGASAALDGTTLTITLDNAVDSFSFNCNGSQLRATKMVVTTVIDDNAPTINLSGDNYVEITNTLSLTENHSNIEGTATWSSDTEGVATVDNNGVVTPIAMGKTIITATIGNISASKEITVYPASGEVTIALALEICDLTGSTNSPIDYTVCGYIESIDTEYSSDYNNISVTITDGTDSLVVFRMAGGDDLKEGDAIKVTGNLVTYGTTREFAEGATYEVVADETVEAIREKLNAIAAEMSLAYQYNRTDSSSNELIDTLDKTFTGVTGTSYSEWKDKTASSGAVYAGVSAAGNESIQLRTSGKNEGVVTTVSGGKVKSITITWNSNTSATRVLEVYGSNTAYTAASELYSTDTQGDKLGVLAFADRDADGKSTLTIAGDYAYIGFKSSTSALYLTDVSIVWESDVAQTVTTYSDSEFVIRCGVDAGLASIEGVDSYGIKVSAGGNEVLYNVDNASSWTNDGTRCYVTISLGDIINDVTKLGTEFTVQAYVVIDGVTYVSTSTKTHSVATMVTEYNGMDGVDVSDLYDYLVEKGLIVVSE